MNPENGFWQRSEKNNLYQPSPLSLLIPDYKTHFNLMGKLFAKAMLEGLSFGFSFTQSFIKHILGKNLYI